MSIQDKLLKAAAGAAPGGITPSEHFGVVLYEGDGSSSHSINGGKFGAGGYFNGSNSKITSTLPNITGNPTFSISFWVNPTSTGTPIMLGNASNGAAFLTFINSSNKLNFGRYGDTLGDSTASVPNSTWTHIAISNNAGSVQLYINGTADLSFSTTYNIGSGNFYIGAANTSQYLEGKIDQFRFFQKALSSSEVSTLYAETASTVESLSPLGNETTDTLQVLGDSSCIATYRFENNEDDLSGNYNGTGTAIQYAAGRYGQAASFNGSSSKITTSGKPLNGNTTVSISFWAKNISYGDYVSILGEGGDSSTAGYRILWKNSNDGNMTLARSNGSGGYIIPDSYFYDFGVDGSNWVHCAFTVSASEMKYYKNGQNVLTQSISNSATTVAEANFGICADPNYSNRLWSGQMDQVRLFNKTLSAAEVTTLYNENSLVASYRFEGNANDDMRTYDGTASNVTYEYGLNFTPDLVWLKQRDAVRGQNWYDSTRGVENVLFSNSSGAASQETAGTTLGSFDTGGFTVGTGNGVNADGGDFVAWCLKANGGTTTSVSGTNISSATQQVNTDIDFSITQFTEGSSGTSAVPHGLSGTPDMYIVKRTGGAQDWYVWHNGLSAGNSYLILNSTAAQASNNNMWTQVDSTNINLGAWNTEGGGTKIIYAFKNVDGFSKFGSYVGNGGTSNIVEIGFEPAFIMIKYLDAADQWILHDNKRDLTNPRTANLRANSTDAEIEYADYAINFLSNGFELLTNQSGQNADGGDYIYVAFAADADTESPTVAKSFSTNVFTDNATADSLSVDVGFKPGLIWTKYRGGSQQHYIYDNIRSKYDYLSSNDTYGNQTRTFGIEPTENGFTKFGNVWNRSGTDQIVVWAWKADDNEPTIFGGAATSIYKFEDNANDVTGNNNGTASNVTYVTGKFNKAVQFNGSNSDIDLASRVDDLGGHCSFSVWINRGSSPTNAETFLKDNTNNDNKITFGSSNSGEGNRIFIRVMTSGGRRQVFVDPSTTIGDNNWHHIAITMNQTANEIKIYLDGELVKTDTSSPSISRGLSFDTIGKDDTYGVYSGKFDQIRIYRGVLEQIHVTELYNETASDNDDLTLGGPPETIISANANAGFSIVKYEGTGVTGTRVPHGLSSAPELWIGKQLTGSAINWQVLYSGFSEGDYLTLNTSAAKGNSANVTFDPTATTVKFHANQALNDSGEEYIGYAFHSVSNYSKIGTYSGNNTGQTITTGFQPDFLMLKKTNVTSEWWIMDSVRGTTNNLEANTSDAENTGISGAPTFVSTGFNFSGSTFNETGTDWIYIAFKIN